MGILDGVRVVDFGTALSAPYAAMLLADLGADVIKVEKPRRGDLMRFTDTYVGGQSGYFLGINRGKRGITLDLRTPRGRDIALDLCRDADIVIENFTAGVMDGWGWRTRTCVQWRRPSSTARSRPSAPFPALPPIWIRHHRPGLFGADGAHGRGRRCTCQGGLARHGRGDGLYRDRRDPGGGRPTRPGTGGVVRTSRRLCSTRRTR